MKSFLVVGFILCSIMSGCKSPPTNNRTDITILPTTAYNYNRDTAFSFKSLQDTSILQLCFSPIKIINKKIAIWKPATDDFFNMPISDDGLCHTKIDTIINLKTENYLIIFRTDAYYDDHAIVDCHICSPSYGIATIEKDKGIYIVQNFKKDLISAGSFGNGYDTLAVEKFGKYDQLLKISSSYTGTSTSTMTNTYFELNHFKEVFSYFPYREVGDSTELDPIYSKIEQNLIHIPGKDTTSGTSDIEIKGSISYYDQTKKKIRVKDIKEIYREDDFGNYKRALQ